MNSRFGSLDNHTNRNLPPDIPDLKTIITALEMGTSMTQYKKGVGLDKVFHLDMTQFKISWCRPGVTNSTDEEGCVYIENIKQLQRGCSSKDFLSVARKLNSSECCLFLDYGNSFRLKTISCMAQNAQEREFWVEGVKCLIERSEFSSPKLLTSRWLQREWASIPKNNKERMSMRECKIFLQKANIKPNSKEIREMYRGSFVDQRGLDLDQLSSAFNAIIVPRKLAEKYKPFFDKTNLSQTMCTMAFQNFLNLEQKEARASDLEFVQRLMSYVKNVSIPENFSAQLTFTMSDFLGYLFHPMNSIFNEAHRVVYQDMSKPLSWYWISSSHNTYLTGDQLQSQSSEDAYARVLRMGCRCVELDCWDGPNNEPIIYHGHTLTTKIKFVDVVKVIAANAFTVTDYPLVLSIENHCSIPQQEFMAQIFKRYLGEFLVTEKLDPNETDLPSPEDLKRRIILKQKRLRGTNDTESSRLSLSADDNLLCKARKNGVMYMKDECGNWNKHLVIVWDSKLLYSEPQDDDADKEEEENDISDGTDLTNTTDQVLNEKWFHRHIDRPASEKLLRDSGKGNGSFLVRASIRFPGDYSISFLYNNSVMHVHIHSKSGENGRRKFSMVSRKEFDNLSSLIRYYQVNPIKTEFHVTLREAVEEVNAHLYEDWYHNELSREQAIDMLSKMKLDGYFLVRKRIDSTSESVESFAISFRTLGEVKHCRVVKEEGQFMVGNTAFESLIDIVTYYQKHPLYRKTKLKHSCNEKVVQECGINANNVEDDSFYTMPNLSPPTTVCRALYSYTRQKEDELTFEKGALIVNVKKILDSEWWQGDYNGQIAKWFPVVFTEELEEVTQPTSDEEQAQTDKHNDVENLLDDIDQTNSIDLTGCYVNIIGKSCANKYDMFQLNTKQDGTICCSVAGELDEWIQCIKDAADMALIKQGKLKGEVESKNIAESLSNLVVYCVPTPYSEDVFKNGRYYEMSSMTELKVGNLTSRNSPEYRLLEYHNKQITRVFPKGTRVDSSNYDPVPLWNFGVQMCALNYQTPDRSMQIERGLFLDNGGCGYVLKPDVMRQPGFDPYNPETFQQIQPKHLRIEILAARHLPKTGRGVTCPFVEVEIVGVNCDSNSQRTQTLPDNGLSPTWSGKEPFEFVVTCPTLAKLFFVVRNEDMFGDNSFVAQACFPVTSLRQGFRSVPLKNGFSENLPLAALLVDIKIHDSSEDEEYHSIATLRDRMATLMEKQSEIESDTDTEEQLNLFQDELSGLTLNRGSRLNKEARNKEGDESHDIQENSHKSS